MVKGYQGNDLSKNNTIMSCVKHYALYGAAEAGRDYNTTDMSHQAMYNEYFPPYKAAIDAGVGSVMASFNEVDGIPATANKWLLTDVLRKQWGFKGFVVTDYTGINEMVDHGIGDLQTVSAKALMAGIDMDMVGEGILTTTKKITERRKSDNGKLMQPAEEYLKQNINLGCLMILIAIVMRTGQKQKYLLMPIERKQENRCPKFCIAEKQWQKITYYH